MMKADLRYGRPPGEKQLPPPDFKHAGETIRFG